MHEFDNFYPDLVIKKVKVMF